MQFVEARTAIVGTICLLVGIAGSTVAYGEDAISDVQARLRRALEYRAAISAIDVEFDVSGAAPKEYAYLRHFWMLDDLRKQEDWTDGRFIRIVEDVRNAPDVSRQAEGLVRELKLFDGERHVLYGDALAGAAMKLTDRDLLRDCSTCRFIDARFVGMIAVGYNSLWSRGPEAVYLSTKALDGRIEQVGASEVLSWRLVWPSGSAVYEVTLDPACDGQPAHARLSSTDEFGRHVSDVRVEYRKTNGVFFPSKINYDHFDDDRRTEWEKIDVRVIHLNQGLDRSDFSLAQADVPPLTPVSLSRGNTESLWWDGQKVVGLEELQAYQRRRRMQQWSVAGVLGVAAAAVTFVLLRRRKK